VLNVLDPDAIFQAVQEIGLIDVLFNCAGVVHSGTVLEMPDKELQFPSTSTSGRRSIPSRPSCRRCWNARRCDHQHGDRREFGEGVPNRAAYSISKRVIGLTKSIAADYTAKGIRVNAICRAPSRALAARALGATGNIEDARKAFVARQPIGRIGQPRKSPTSPCTSPRHLHDGPDPHHRRGWTA